MSRDNLLTDLFDAIVKNEKGLTFIEVTGCVTSTLVSLIEAGEPDENKRKILAIKLAQLIIESVKE